MRLQVPAIAVRTAVEKVPRLLRQKSFDWLYFPEKYAGIYMTPTETRAMFEQRGWKSVAAFQTRNPMHRSHEHLAKIAIEIWDGVMVHSLLGNLQPGDIPAEVRQEAISTWSSTTSWRTPWCNPATRWTCVTPAPARRCCMRCSVRTTAARI